VPKNIPAQAQRTKSSGKAPVLTLPGSEEARYPEYIPTPIWQTRYSEFWQWQRVNEWWREYGEDDCRRISHEKRHILV
jgi:trehalose-6-phosphate synthase